MVDELYLENLAIVTLSYYDTGLRDLSHTLPFLFLKNSSPSRTTNFPAFFLMLRFRESTQPDGRVAVLCEVDVRLLYEIPAFPNLSTIAYRLI